jgi:hypothetical protein
MEYSFLLHIASRRKGSDIKKVVLVCLRKGDGPEEIEGLVKTWCELSLILAQSSPRNERTVQVWKQEK